MDIKGGKKSGKETAGHNQSNDNASQTSGALNPETAAEKDAGGAETADKPAAAPQDGDTAPETENRTTAPEKTDARAIGPEIAGMTQPQPANPEFARAAANTLPLPQQPQQPLPQTQQPEPASNLPVSQRVIDEPQRPVPSGVRTASGLLSDLSGKTEATIRNRRTMVQQTLPVKTVMELLRYSAEEFVLVGDGETAPEGTIFA